MIDLNGKTALLTASGQGIGKATAKVFSEAGAYVIATDINEKSLSSLQEFVDEIDDEYDLIISNPPFYTSTYKEISEERAMARHTESLTYHELLEGTSKLLSEIGSCAFIIPFSEEENFIELAKQQKLFPNRITRVKGTENSPIKRTLLQFSFSTAETEIDELVIEIERHQYTSAYIKLVEDFYLKM